MSRCPGVSVSPVLQFHCWLASDIPYSATIGWKKRKLLVGAMADDHDTTVGLATFTRLACPETPLDTALCSLEGFYPDLDPLHPKLKTRHD